MAVHRQATVAHLVSPRSYVRVWGGQPELTDYHIRWTCGKNAKQMVFFTRQPKGIRVCKGCLVVEELMATPRVSWDSEGPAPF
jgi:hypothetical protein